MVSLSLSLDIVIWNLYELLWLSWVVSVGKWEKWENYVKWLSLKIIIVTNFLLLFEIFKWKYVSESENLIFWISFYYFFSGIRWQSSPVEWKNFKEKKKNLLINWEHKSKWIKEEDTKVLFHSDS